MPSNIQRAIPGLCKSEIFVWIPNGNFSEPVWWTKKDWKKGPESSIRADLYGVTENLLIIEAQGEEKILA
jgi:hypothetical protein